MEHEGGKILGQRASYLLLSYENVLLSRRNCGRCWGGGHGWKEVDDRRSIIAELDEPFGELLCDLRLVPSVEVASTQIDEDLLASERSVDGAGKLVSDGEEGAHRTA